MLSIGSSLLSYFADDEDNILEETESVDYSEEYLGRCVTIKDLCNKLKPVKVTDPFSGPSVEKEKLLLR